MNDHTQDVMFGQGRGDWGTPRSLFNRLDEVFSFNLDAAANQDNALCTVWLGPGSPVMENALTPDFAWSGVGSRIWLNPPYGRGIGEWLAKAEEARQQGCCVVVLLPARTDTRWFKAYKDRVVVEFLPGRLTFEGAPDPAPFPSMLLFFFPKWI